MNIPGKEVKKFRPTKKLGQNFLKDAAVVTRICDAAELSEGDTVIEAGPGHGILTEKIQEKAGLLYAVEKDTRLYDQLKTKFSGAGNVKIINGDFLKTDIKKFKTSDTLKFVSNIPYNITSPILSILIENSRMFSDVVIMVQRELGDRMRSSPGVRVYGSLSVIVQTYFEIKKVCLVPPEAFKPKPKVESIVLKLNPTDKYSKKISDHSLYKSIVRASFSSKRKMLSNSLRSAFAKDYIDACLKRSGIEGKRRAETLTIEEFIKLADNFHQLQQSSSSTRNLF